MLRNVEKLLTKVKVLSVDVNHYQTLNELKVEMHPDKTFIGQELVAMGEHWGGDVCCEQSTLMEVRHSTRSPFLYFSPWSLVQMPVSKLYLVTMGGPFGHISSPVLLQDCVRFGP
jgi:hypothetical protein